MKVFKSLLAVSALSLIMTSGCTVAGGSDAGIIKTLSSDQLMEVLSKEGLVPERTKETVIRVKMDQV
jgi:hypothetical protein